MSRREPAARSMDVLASAGLVVMWSSGFIGADLGTRQAPADTLLAWRYMAAGAVLGGVTLARAAVPGRREAVRHGVVGLLCQGLYLGGVVTGVGLGVPAGTAALVAALQPLVVAVLASALLGGRATTAQRAGLVLGLAGVGLVVGGDLRLSDGPAWAYLLPAAGMLSLSAGTVLDRRWGSQGGLLDALTVQTLTVAALVITGTAAAGRLEPPAEPAFWWAVAWVVVLSTFGGYGCYFLVLRRSGATRVSALLYLTPPTTMLWAAMLFGETPGPLALAGAGVCAAGVALTLRPAVRPTADPATTCQART